MCTLKLNEISIHSTPNISSTSLSSFLAHFLLLLKTDVRDFAVNTFIKKNTTLFHFFLACSSHQKKINLW